MERPVHSMSNLFAQLGLKRTMTQRSPALSPPIKPLPEDVKLHEADFWSPSQAGFSLRGDSCTMPTGQKWSTN
jgi:hypothetical protein